MEKSTAYEESVNCMYNSDNATPAELEKQRLQWKIRAQNAERQRRRDNRKQRREERAKQKKEAAAAKQQRRQLRLGALKTRMNSANLLINGWLALGISQNVQSSGYKRMRSLANSTGKFVGSSYSAATWNAVVARLVCLW